MMKTLAIFAPHLGTTSETFIHRHIDGLLPGRTVLLSHSVSSTAEGWRPAFPHYQIRKSRNPIFRAVRAAGYALGCDRAEYFDVSGIKQFLREQGVDVLLGQYLDVSWPFIEICRDLNIHFFAHAHGYDLSSRFRQKRWQRRYAEYRHIDGVIVVNRLMRDRMLALGMPDEKIHIVPYGVDPTEPSWDKAHNGPIRCLAVGRMVGKKAPSKLLEAVRLALHAGADIHLDYVGAGPLFNTAQNYVQRHQLADRVALHGGRSHGVVLDLMRGADIFLQHSMIDPQTGDEEGVPVAILEAMAMGLPVVATRHAGIPEAVIEEETGYLVAEGDVAGMAEQIIKLAGDRELRIALGRRGRLRVMEYFSWQREKTKLLAVLESRVECP